VPDTAQVARAVGAVAADMEPRRIDRRWSAAKRFRSRGSMSSVLGTRAAMPS